MQGTLFARRSAAITWSLIGVDYAYFDKLRMIVPIANVFEAGKPLFCGLDRPLAAPGGADDYRALTGSYTDIESSVFVQTTYPVNRSELNPGRLQRFFRTALSPRSPG